MKVVVTGSSGDAVAVHVLYRKTKPVSYHGKVGGSGQYTKTWKVPTWAPLGKGYIKVEVSGRLAAKPPTIDFTVVK